MSSTEETTLSEEAEARTEVVKLNDYGVRVRGGGIEIFRLDDGVVLAFYAGLGNETERGE